jgi:hypothetical protein
LSSSDGNADVKIVAAQTVSFQERTENVAPNPDHNTIPLSPSNPQYQSDWEVKSAEMK